jgi:hypothetical protein
VHGSKRFSLVRLDPDTFAADAEGAVPLTTFARGWSFSGDGGVLALLVGDRVALFDAATLQPRGQVAVPAGGFATRWMGDRVAVFSWRTGVVVSLVDPGTLRVVSRSSFAGQPVAVAGDGSSAVVLLAPKQGIGVARLATVGPTGRARVVTLKRIAAGVRSGDRGHAFPVGFRQVKPALAIDPDGGRAFVVTAGMLVAEVALGPLSVTYHQARERRSLLSRFRRWLVPAAGAKGFSGPVRQGLWLGDGLLAVAGFDGRLVVNGGNLGLDETPAGAWLVDTDSWTLRSLDRSAALLRRAGALLLTSTPLYSLRRGIGPSGLNAFALDGTQTLHLLGGSRVWLVGATPERAFVRAGSKLLVVDLATGLVTRQTVPSRSSDVQPLTGDPPSCC